MVKKKRVAKKPVANKPTVHIHKIYIDTHPFKVAGCTVIAVLAALGYVVFAHWYLSL